MKKYLNKIAKKSFMVLESLLNPMKAERMPWEMFFVGLIYSSIAIILSLWIFRDQVSLLMVFLTVMACLPIVYNAMKLEESKDIKISNEKLLLKEHNKAIVFLMFLFLGITTSFVIWYVFLPTPTLDLVFDKQTSTIQAINNKVSGNIYGDLGIFKKIFLNNIKVLAFAILFAFIYGAGAIFILTWNASVIGAAIGNFIRVNMGQYAESIGLAKVSSYFGVISIGLLRYVLHGIPEILAYFYGGLAGGILSVAVINGHFKDKKFSIILFDISELIAISIIFLIVAAFIEVYITPVLF
jgi:uncharacterized membrane protein SpoIIM required for sporulation